MRCVVVLLLLASALTACSDGDGTEPLPDGVKLRMEQVRQDLTTRQFQIQVVNGSAKAMTVERAALTSGRFDGAARYRGPATIQPGTTVNLSVQMPRARCGEGVDATVSLTYTVGDDTRTSKVRPSDPHESLARILRRDCANHALGRLVIDRRLQVKGHGKDATLGIGFTITPPRSGNPVHVEGVDGSTVLAPASPDATTVDRTVRPGGEPLHATVTMIPNRCDVHVVAEDRTGGALLMRVSSEEFGEARVYLRFDEAQQAQIFDYVAERCGFGTVQDPLNAP